MVQFKPKSQPEWMLLSNNVLPDQDILLVRELSPGSWYDLLVIAKNEAGTTEANYVFATLTMDGSTVAPLLGHEGHERSQFEAVVVLVPSMCALFVLIFVGLVVTYLVFYKPRHGDGDHQANHCE